MWPNPQETTVLVTFTEEILIGKLHFSCSVRIQNSQVVSDFSTKVKAYHFLGNYVAMNKQRDPEV